MPKLTIEELRRMRETAKRGIHLREGKSRGRIIVHMGTCGIAAGARTVMSACLDELENRDLTDIMLTSSGCAGLCSKEPMATVEIAGSAPVRYGSLTPEKVKKIVEEHIIGGNAVEKFVIGIGSERVA
jgi:NADP-reducing hydrogenase subunit HndB